MTKVNITLPNSMKDFVDARISSGDYGNASEYVRRLIREDQKRAERERIDALLLEGVKSGNSTPMTSKDWKTLRQNLRKRMANAKAK